MEKQREIEHVCDECGIEANRQTCVERYGVEPKKIKHTISTYHKGKCDCCGQTKMVTDIRDFFYPNFDSLERKGND